ncbi:hypothetical protein Tco_0726721 [Tanacetum coccineum]|uniref:Retrovirus-related Pol polyprotein from transposon TNT 1-94-like beta-barrel domain-containing protein n=1 Tax=Tanacetum coccineum TaxID=301880 RepID=A0ABQ4YIN6_9ASTR
MKHSYSNDDTCFSIDVIDEISEKYFVALLDEGSKILYSVEGTLLEDQIFAEFDEFIAMTIKENSKSDSDKEEIPFKKITFDIDYKIKKSIDEPPMDLELKPLPNRLEYAFLEEPSFLPVIISSQLSEQNKNKLVSVLKKHKQSFSWKTTDIPVICPSFYKHKIQLLEDKRPVVQKQRRLNPNMKEVFKKEIVKLLDTRIIYQIADYPWVLRRSRSSLLQFCGDLETKDKSLARASDTRSSQEYLNDLEEEYQARVLLAKSKSKEGARNGEWVKISMRKILVLKQAKLDFLTMQHVNTEILKENQNLKKELKDLTTITEIWLDSSNKVNQCIIEQIPTQKERILGVDQLTEDPFSSGQKDLVFVKSLADDTKVSIPGVERPWLSEARCFIFPNHDTGRILPTELQRNITDPPITVTDFSATNYDSADESSVCSTPLSPLKKLDGVEPNSGPKTIKLILNYDHDTNGHNRIISLEREINPRNPQHAFKRCEVYGSSTQTTTDHYDIEWFKRGEALQAKKSKALKLTRCNIRKPIWYLDSGCSRHMTGVKSYLHKYVEQPGPKVVFGDDSTCTTEGYGSIKCNDIVFTKVAFVDGLKYNLISVSQLCDAKYIVQFDEKRGTIFNSNKEVVMIAPRLKIKLTSKSNNLELTMVLNSGIAFLSTSVMKKGFLKTFPLSVFNTRRQQTEENYHITFDESPNAINFLKPLVDNINISENKRYPPDEYLHPYEPS